MCEELNWTGLARLLGSLQTWFRTRIPRSFVCFLDDGEGEGKDAIPFPCIQFLAREELTVREIAEMTTNQLADKLIAGMAMTFGVSQLSTLLRPLESHCSVEQPRYRNYEHFHEDMYRVAEVIHRKAFDRRLEMIANRAVKELEMYDLSLLISPLVTEREAMLNALENENQSEGERSDGVLSGSEDIRSQIASDEESEDGERDPWNRLAKRGGSKDAGWKVQQWQSKRLHTSGNEEYTVLAEEESEERGGERGREIKKNIVASQAEPTQPNLGIGVQTTSRSHSYGASVVTSHALQQYGGFRAQMTFQKDYNAIL